MDVLQERVAQVAGVRNAAEAAAVDLVADVLDDGSWESLGLSTPRAWVAWHFGLTPSRAGVMCTIAQRRAELPTVMSLFGQGRLSTEQVHLIARRCPGAYEHDVAHFALAATLPQLSRTLRTYRFAEDAGEEPGEAAVSTPRRSGASLSFDESGRFRFVAEGDAEAGARLRGALDQFHTRLLQDGTDVDPYPSTFDAFMALVDSGTDADLSTSRRHRHRTLLHIEADALADWAAGRLPSLHLGPVVDRPTMELLTCEGEVTILLTRFGRPLRLGRSTRVVPDRLRAIIVNRDGGCRVCGRTVNLDVHHVVHWSSGGPTDPSNLVTVCSRCHTAHHNGEITITGDPSRLPTPAKGGQQASSDGLAVVNRYGIRLNRRPPPKPPDDHHRLPSGHYHHPAGERLRSADVLFAPTATTPLPSGVP